MKWVYGVTTVPGRRTTLLPRTLASLAAGGFDRPRLFVDGDGGDDTDFGLQVTRRSPVVRIYGNWILSLLELYVRDPDADRYCIFQDDLVCVRNLRQYLDTKHLRPSTYWNLYTAMENDDLVGSGFVQGVQRGRGALALVFDRAGVVDLLSSPSIARKPQDPNRGWRTVDGAVTQALSWSELRYKEMVHLPSLVQHTGAEAVTLPERYPIHGYCFYPLAKTFPGESFNALEMSDATVQR